MLFCCLLPKFGKVPKGQSNILHPKMSQIARNFSATSATSLVQLLDFLSATFWGDYTLLHIKNVISVQPSFDTPSLAVITLSRPLNSSQLQITNRSLRYASPYLWNKLPLLFCQPHFPDQSPPALLCSVDIISSCSPSPILLSITPSLFHTKLTIYLFHKSFLPLFLYHRTDFMDFWTCIIGFYILASLLLILLVDLSWLPVSF